ncbi:hypothetical protein U1Q18_039529, partial [Sarracenia purpurea var. burkii]
DRKGGKSLSSSTVGSDLVQAGARDGEARGNDGCSNLIQAAAVRGRDGTPDPTIVRVADGAIEGGSTTKRLKVEDDGGGAECEGDE